MTTCSCTRRRASASSAARTWARSPKTLNFSIHPTIARDDVLAEHPPDKRILRLIPRLAGVSPWRSIEDDRGTRWTAGSRGLPLHVDQAVVG